MVFSVIVPVYNVEQYLAECIKSILEQSFQDFELILVDDGSTDRSGAICDGFAAESDKIRVVHQKNMGQAAARNKGFIMARGTYIIFIDSDDVLADKAAFEMLNRNMGSAPDIVAFKYKKWYPDHISDLHLSFSGIPESNKADTIRELVRRDVFFCSCWSKTVRRSLLVRNCIRFDEMSRCEDMDWYFRVVSSAETICLLDEALILYRQREGSVTKKSGEKGFQDNIAFIDRWKQVIDCESDTAWKETMLSALAKLYCNLLIAFSSNYNVLKKYKAEVYRNKDLLKYDLNPRTKLFRRISRIVGVCMLCQFLRIASALR